MDGSRHILLSQEEGDDMYKLTYDSDENDEVVAPNTPPSDKRPSSDEYDTNASMEKRESKGEILANGEKALSPNLKRTKDVGTYHGNGRFYSLFANDDFVTEDPKRRKKICCIGVKSCLFISAIVILVLAILGMMWVVREVQIEQNHLRQRIKDLENSDTSSSSSSSASQASADVGNLIDAKPPAPPGMPPPPPMILSDDHHCCETNKKSIDYLQEVTKGHDTRFDEIEGKIKRHVTNDDIRNAEISRQLGETSIDVQTALSMISGVKGDLQKVKAVADLAQKLSLFGLKDGKLTNEQIEFYLNAIEKTKTSEDVTFSVVHAKGNDVANHDTVTSGDTDDSFLKFYDVRENFSSAISFTDQMVSGELYIPPESGTFHAPSDGNYVIMMNFCTHDDEETTVDLMRNGVVVRKMKISMKPELLYANDEGLVPPPGLRSPPKPPSYDDLATRMKKVHIRPYQFSELLKLDEGDTLNLHIEKGRIVEYKEKTATCTRFSGFKLN